jgi:hypothetical protein
MYLQRSCTAWLLATACVGLAGCPATTSNSVGDLEDSGLVYRSKVKPEPESSRARIVAKPMSRESALSRYYRPEYGISFRYPRNYILEEGNILEHSYFLKRQEELNLEEPGAHLVATVLIPEDGFPNTTFLHGSLQFVVKNSSSQKECFRSISPEQTGGRTIETFSSEGLRFGGSEARSGTAGTEILERDYAAFTNGTCYEFDLVIALGEPTEGDDLGPGDPQKFTGHLEKIVRSVKFEHQQAVPESLSKAENGLRLELRPK